jgi:hypothetical protein
MPVPRVEEDALCGLHHRALHADGAIMPEGFPRIRHNTVRRRVLIGTVEIDAAHDSHFAVCDNQLAVVTIVQMPGKMPAQRVDRAEFQSFYTGRLHLVDQLFGRAMAAGAIVDHRHLHIAGARRKQRLHDATVTLLHVLKNIIFQMQMTLRRVDGVENRANGHLGAIEQMRGIAVQDGAGGERLVLSRVPFERGIASLVHGSRYADIADRWNASSPCAFSRHHAAMIAANGTLPNAIRAGP